ncbi:uncharacterized protein METZ01_LOCUS160041, partial [marine metagenome]
MGERQKLTGPTTAVNRFSFFRHKPAGPRPTRRLAKRLALGMIAAVRVMHEVSFLQDLAVVMIAAGIVTVLFQRL